MNDERIKIVKRGYDVAALKYLKEKDLKLLQLPIFKRWLSKSTGVLFLSSHTTVKSVISP